MTGKEVLTKMKRVVRRPLLLRSKDIGTMVLTLIPLNKYKGMGGNSFITPTEKVVHLGGLLNPFVNALNENIFFLIGS